MMIADLPKHLVEVNGIHIVPGLKQVSPPDVMRGEETQLFALDDSDWRRVHSGNSTQSMSISSMGGSSASPQR
jgi:2-dehydro-3-deoxygalactonokinase